MAHSDEEFDEVTEFQKQLLFPLLKAELTGNENLLLDFGCGPGRFTAGLADLIHGKAIGADIIADLLALAPKDESVSYQLIEEDALPFPDCAFDVVWSCLVLGGIPDNRIARAVAEINRVLRPGGIFFFVENAAKLDNTAYWTFRSEETYVKLAEFCSPGIVGSYLDMGQQIVIFSGKKR
ncbi:class I SAM-dependent methyltransferase [Janthinobacterium sp. 17J80-10]|uniref:class I SAM-dependent methyltransferase n=1 Tax=Janthinobacterium sp. 17J80-10 TaxID=2497863 RepID=UPI0013E8AC18|nr:class I SAM-dependent methyltransferase [Janthinobacterium sp. 17J80-10]